MKNTTTCIGCGKTGVGVDPSGFLYSHKRKAGPLCSGSGRHISFNGPAPTTADIVVAEDYVHEGGPGAMHEPKPYTGELDWSEVAPPHDD